MTRIVFIKFVFTLLFSLFLIPVKAQFLKIDIGINGLTCSQCSRSVEMQLRKLGFVHSVQMDLESTKGTLLLNENVKVDMDAIARSVQDAGFSVRYLKATVKPGIFSYTDGSNCLIIEGDAYVLLKPLDSGREITTLQFIGKDYLPGKEWKDYSIPEKSPCKGRHLYYVTVIN